MTNYVQNFAGDITIAGGITSSIAQDETAYLNQKDLSLTLSTAGTYRFVSCSGNLTITSASAVVHMIDCDLQITNSVGAIIRSSIEKVGDTVNGALKLNSPTGVVITSAGSAFNEGLIIDNGNKTDGTLKEALVLFGKRELPTSKIILRDIDGSLKFSTTQQYNTLGLKIDNDLSKNGLTWNGKAVFHAGNAVTTTKIFDGNGYEFNTSNTPIGSVFIVIPTGPWYLNMKIDNAGVAYQPWGLLVFGTTDFGGSAKVSCAFMGDIDHSTFTASNTINVSQVKIYRLY